MAIKGKSLNLFLMDGIATGRVKCTLANWTGVAYRVPRTELNNPKFKENLSEKSKYQEHLNQSGVYFLFGVSDETGDDFIYVGQANARKNGEGIFNRIREHNKNEDTEFWYWKEAIVFTTSNNTFGPTEISYLENKFYNLAKKANRYIVKNSIDPLMGHVTEEKESELEEFIEYALIVMGTLGHRVFESLEEIGNMEENIGLNENIQPLLYLETAKAKATGKRTNEGFIVFKGAKVADNPTRSCPDTTLNLRKRYKDKIENQILKEDLLFTSPSAASNFLKYAASNGLTEWKDDQGQTLKEIELINE